jgi:ferritin-like metal-binding protein YciE
MFPMRKNSVAVKTIQDLFVDELRDIYSAEKQLTRALPRMAKKAAHPELKQAFELHLEQTRGQVERLDQVFEQLDMPKRAKKCVAMEGLIEEAQSNMEEINGPELLDVGMIINAQKIEHYEIAGYGSLVALARQLGHDEAASLLEETLDEEKQTDQKLNDIAQAVNQMAAGGSQEGESAQPEQKSQRSGSAKGRK